MMVGWVELGAARLGIWMNFGGAPAVATAAHNSSQQQPAPQHHLQLGAAASEEAGGSKDRAVVDKIKMYFFGQFQFISGCENLEDI